YDRCIYYIPYIFPKIRKGYNDIFHFQTLTNMIATIFGIIAGILTSIRLIPQLYKSIKIKETRDISLWFLIILFFQALFLILYGITKPDMLITYMNILPLICGIILIYLKSKYK
ncbi:MAG: SemiSWEET family transporter, partial [Candidatus Thermoplasmatota archaeon]|nr:SemiSWEET family transporter [Candidatus Thermoplasmatota archaeon]